MSASIAAVVTAETLLVTADDQALIGNVAAELYRQLAGDPEAWALITDRPASALVVRLSIEDLLR